MCIHKTYIQKPQLLGVFVCIPLLFKLFWVSISFFKQDLKKDRCSKFYFELVIWGVVVGDVRTIFERRNDATIYIPTFMFEIETRLS
jgi:hypothetical protein